MRTHALLSPSSSHIWLNCPPSARLGERFPDTASPSAAEGTLAHSVAELALRHILKMIDKRTYNRGMKDLNDDRVGGMLTTLEDYVTMVTEKVNEAHARSSDAAVLLEETLDYSPWVPEGHGIGDVVIISDGLVEVIDLKYGAGIPVSAENNPQLRMYGLGAYNNYDLLYGVDEVRMTIVQPRRDSVSSETLTASELLAWGEGVKAIAQRAYNGEGVFKPGEHCTFCRAGAICRARAEHALELARYEFNEPDTLEPHEIPGILDRIDELVAWSNRIKHYALSEALKGQRWDGYKLVEGRSVRQYADTTAISTTLLQNGYTDNDIYTRELLGITAMEKLLKKRFDELIGDYIIKPPGKPALVPETDKRPEWNALSSAQDEFTDYEEEI